MTRWYGCLACDVIWKGEVGDDSPCWICGQPGSSSYGPDLRGAAHYVAEVAEAEEEVA